MSTTTSPLESRYHDRLRNMPPEKQGRHQFNLGTANLGAMIGKSPEEVHEDIRRATANAPMPDREVQATIAKAFHDHQADPTYRIPPKPVPLVKDGQAARRRIIGRATISTEADLWEASTITPPGNPLEDSTLLLSTLFHPAERVFVGDRLEPGIIGKNIRSTASWCDFFRAGGSAGPHIIINPLSGATAPKKDGSGGVTLRGDGNVHPFRYCLAEFDTLTREDQIRFWSAAKLPIVALIDSGGKSIHAWIDVQKWATVTTADQWAQQVKLYEQVLIPMGVDRACSNPARLSRLPGVLRNDTGRWQRLLWLSPEGRGVVR